MEMQRLLRNGNRMSNQSLAAPLDIFNTAIADAERILTLFDKLDNAWLREAKAIK
jgi:hypothetical protein